MQTELVKIPPAVTEMIALMYQGMTAAQEYARQIAIDPNTPHALKPDMRYIAACITDPVERIHRRIPKQNLQAFNEQVRNNDQIRLDNVKSLYIRMLPAQQELMERVMMGVLNGEIIEIDCTGAHDKK